MSQIAAITFATFNAATRLIELEESVMRHNRVHALACFVLGASLGSATAAEIREVNKVVPQTSPLAEIAQGRSPEASVAGLLELDTSSSLKALPNRSGATLRLEQQHNGIPVWGQQIVAERSADGTRIVAISGTAAYDLGPALTAKITKQQALQKAKEIVLSSAPTLRASSYENEEADLVYLVQKKGEVRLVYRTSFFTTVRDGTAGPRPTRPVLFIDAITGETVSSYENLQHAQRGTGPGGNAKTGQYTYGSETVPPFEVSEQGSICEMDSPDVFTEHMNYSVEGTNKPFAFRCYNNAGDNINGAFSPLNDAQFFGQVVVDMYRDWYGVSPLKQKLHLRVHFSRNEDTAFWNGSSMTFGDGKAMFYPLVGLDVVAHEVSHGFTEQNSNLEYQYQSGGMNESFSDMAGEAAESYYFQKYGNTFGRSGSDLTVGADVTKKAGTSLRYMCDPPQDGYSIDHVSKYSDRLDVHHSSGIYNKVFCILKRSGWDIRKAFHTFVVANQDYWTLNATFQNGAEGVLRAADKLKYETKDVVFAFDQVGISCAMAASRGEDKPRWVCDSDRTAAGSVN
ncbi:peptidase M4 family protein [Bradyrhizobium sp. NBAIM20]|uniref:M4 family metallopeptidase n=1 Tax=unclassified Bradyrhizobium TaxID=2631580 RepID=UPI001CD52A72|nr:MULTISPECIES: M4 family metallopeptidase [unclassified Bradyrhizobium]MCA1416661.1 peptidase M4 family protein [Bradyrhizobium sp. NBAIM20]MCA1466219.1 peptidase M4 family protein [Bradyrhizobium sp. NBAIM18]